jgi:hypothetical protein
VHAGTANVRDADEFVRKTLGVAPTDTVVASLRRFVATTGRTPTFLSTHWVQARVGDLKRLAAIGVPVHGAHLALVDIIRGQDQDRLELRRMWKTFWYRLTHENPDVEDMELLLDGLRGLRPNNVPRNTVSYVYSLLAAVARRPATAEYLFGRMLRPWGDGVIPLHVVETLVARVPKTRLECLLLTTLREVRTGTGPSVREVTGIAKTLLEAGADPFKEIRNPRTWRSAAGTLRFLPDAALAETLLSMFLPYGGNTRDKAMFLEAHVKGLVASSQNTSSRAMVLVREIKPHLSPLIIKRLQSWSDKALDENAKSRFRSVFGTRPRPAAAAPDHTANDHARRPARSRVWRHVWRHVAGF